MKQYTESRWGLALCGALGLAAAYVLASLAIDTGHYWQYLATMIVLWFSIKFLIKAARGK